MLSRSWMIAAFLLCSINAAPVHAPTADSTTVARSLVTTIKLTDQLKAILPTIMQGLKAAIVQNRPEVERDFNANVPKMLHAFDPYYNEMVEGVVAVYASNFTAQELHDIEVFYQSPTGQKMLEKTPTILQQNMAVGRLIGQKAAQDLRNLMIEELRKQGHKI